MCEKGIVYPPKGWCYVRELTDYDEELIKNNIDITEKPMRRGG